MKTALILAAGVLPNIKCAQVLDGSFCSRRAKTKVEWSRGEEGDQTGGYKNGRGVVGQK